MEKKKFKNQEALMTAALDEFSGTDYEQASLNKIIKQSGISKGTFYYRFKNKEALYRCVVEHSVKKKIEYIESFIKSRSKSFETLNIFEQTLLRIKAEVMFSRNFPKQSILNKRYYVEKDEPLMKPIAGEFGVLGDSAVQILSREVHEAYESGLLDKNLSIAFIEQLMPRLLTLYEEVFVIGDEQDERLKHLEEYVIFLENGLTGARASNRTLLDEYSQNVQEQEKMLQSQEMMLELSNSMIEVESLDELLHIILEKAIQVIDKGEYGSLLVMDSEGLLEFKAIMNYSADLFDIRLVPEETYQWSATDGHFDKPVILENLEQFSADFVNRETHDSMESIEALVALSAISAPILIEGKLFGFINIDSDQSHLFNEHDKKILAYFANQASVAIVNHQLYNDMLYLSTHDGLTGLYNRYYFEREAERMITKASTSEHVTVVLVDLNRFKSVNDRYGHEIGDKVLKVFARRFSHQIREGDVLSRFGGDEFAIAFNQLTKEQTVKKMLTIRKGISEDPVVIKELDEHLFIDFSFGIAETPGDGVSVKKLLRTADLRMYRHKNVQY